MRYIKINDDLEYIYEMLQKVFRPSPFACFPRDRRKEEEFYAIKDVFSCLRPPCNGWRVELQKPIPMFYS